MGARGSSHIEWDPFTLVCLSYRDLDLIVIALPYVHNRFSFVPAYSLVNHELSLYTRKPAKAGAKGKQKAKVEAKAKTGKGTNRNLTNSKSVEIKDGNTPKCMQSMVVDATALAAEIEQHSLPTGKERTNRSQSTISASNTEKSSINTVATVPVNNKPARRPT